MKKPKVIQAAKVVRGKAKQAPQYLRTTRGLLTASAALLLVVAVLGVGVMAYSNVQDNRREAKIEDQKSQQYAELTQASRATLVFNYVAENRFAEAHDVVDFSKEPETKDNLLLKASVYEAQQKYSEALQTLRKAEEKHGLDYVTAHTIARLAQLNSDKELAKDYYQKAIDKVKQEGNPDADAIIKDIQAAMDGLDG